jgi:hypothetical protein
MLFSQCLYTLSGPGPPHCQGFTITLRRTTLGRTPLDRDLYLTTHKPPKRQTSMPAAGFEPTIPASERPHTQALDRAATGMDPHKYYHCKWFQIQFRGLRVAQK